MKDIRTIDYITIRLPRNDWNQIINDYENYCGLAAPDIETLQHVTDLTDDPTTHHQIPPHRRQRH